jgi:HSP20 family protein
MLGLRRRENETELARPRGMEMAPWTPWNEFDRLRTELDRLFGSVWGTPPRLIEAGYPVAGGAAFAPAVDMYETADEIVLTAHLPGMSREDIHLEVLGDTIRITGETRSNVPEKDVTVHKAEGAYGRFDLRYTLPVEVKPEECKAVYRNGMLEVRLPKVEAAKPTPIEIRVEG